MDKRLTRWDFLGMAGGLLLTLTITCVLSRQRVFWEDEMLGWMLLRDPSWHHLLFAYNQGADGGGFSFYLLGRAWLSLFGTSELAFRLFSSTCFGLAFAVTWAAARRFYGFGVVAFALFNTWFFSPPFVAHMTEGRFYGLLVLAVALAMWLALVLAETRRPTPLGLYAAIFLIHGLLTTSHLLGVVFSAFLLGATAVLDWWESRPRPLLYVTGAASWLLLLPERSNIAASAKIGKPWFWTQAPRLDEIFGVYTASSKEIALVLFLLSALVAWGFLRGAAKSDLRLRVAWQKRKPVYVVTAAMFLLGIPVWLEGGIGTWLFNDRYLLPMTVAVAYLTAELAQLSLHAVPSAFLQRLSAAPAFHFTAGVAFVAMLLFWDFKHLAKFSPSPEDYTAALTRRLPQGIPVVCEDGFTFTELLGKQHASGVQYMYLLDWAQAISPSAPRVEVTQYHLMQNWRKVGYFSGSIEPIGEFLRQHSQFLVVHAEPIPPHLPPDIGNPLVERLVHNPAYQVQFYTQLDRYRMRDTVWRVCWGRCKERP